MTVSLTARLAAALVVTGGLVLTQASASSVQPSGRLWLTGDTHVHTDHSSDGSTTRQVVSQDAPGTTSVATQISAAERRSLDFLPLTDHRTYEQQWDPQWTSDQVLLIPGEEANGSPHANVLGAADDVVDGANPAGSAGYRHVQQSIWDVHAQDAVWQTNHPDDGETDADGTPNANASATGIDQVEVFNTGDPEPKLDYAENRWNAGFRFGVTAASDNHFSETDAVAGPGLPATRVAAAVRSERGILDGFRSGHSVVFRGLPDSPVATLDADLDGDGHFETLGGDERRAAAGRQVLLRVRVQQGIGSTVYVYRSPGRSVAPLARLTATGLDETFLVPVTVPAGASWYRAEVRRAGGLLGISGITEFPDYRPTDPANQLQSATSPVFLYTDAPAVPRAELPLPPTTGADAAELVAGTAGGFTGFPDVATSGPRTHVVTEEHRDGGTAVRYRLVGPGPGSDAATLADGAARFPRVAARGTDVWVTWQDERGGQTPRRPDVYLRHSADGGRTWQPEQRVTAGAARAERPVVAVLPDGTPVVAWMDNRSGAFDVLVQRIGTDPAPVDVAAPGKAITAGFPFDSRSPRYPSSLFPSLAVAPDGSLAVGWQDNRYDVDPGFTGHTRSLEGPATGGTAPDDYEVLVATLRPGGTWSAPVNASNAPLASDRHPTLLYDGAGTLHVAWDTRALQAAGANLSLRAVTSLDGGRTFGPAVPVAVAPAAMSQKPRLAADPDGTVRLVWYDSRSTDWRWRVLTATRSSAGWSAGTQVSGPANGTYPSVAGGRVVFTSDRAAVGQRDRTQQVFLIDLPRTGAATPGR